MAVIRQQGGIFLHQSLMDNNQGLVMVIELSGLQKWFQTKIAKFNCHFIVALPG